MALVIQISRESGQVFYPYHLGGNGLIWKKAMISYLLQSITTLIFGPILAIIVAIWELKSAQLSHRRAKIYQVVKNIAYSAAKTNVFVSMSVVIASIIRQTQIPPVSEHSFLVLLGFFEMLVILGTVASMITYRNLGDASIMAFGVYFIIVFALSFINTSKSGISSFQTNILGTITMYCESERDYPLPALGNVVVDDMRLWRFFFAYCVTCLAAFTVVGVIFAFCQYIIPALIRQIQTLFDRPCNALDIKPEYHFRCLVILVQSCVWIVSQWIFLSWLKSSRQDLKKASGSLYEDSEWGFGQVTALLAWAPLVHDIILEIFGLLLKSNPSVVYNDIHPLSTLSGLANNAEVTNDTVQISEPIASPSTAINHSRPPSSIHSGPNHVDGGGQPVAIDVQAHESRPQSIDDTVERPRLNFHGSASALSTLGLKPNGGHIERELIQRGTWPRNESGTYLPTSQ
ncbi:uncharacterized protein KY384_008564 [Bacidia gigantensis]|uniref:uncharacterized protein n=1 Tax=Bacidia gigantensis TaxID=2732470 RepID=UPI001D0507FF|nr:uncharacterized protein KY384_008564 [Bacidia gigantensis]KAG8527135.1 hypothetical protein KY384_008564 [Bacidia gigantensis]